MILKGAKIMNRIEYLNYVRKVIAERGGKMPTLAERQKAKSQTEYPQKQARF